MATAISVINRAARLIGVLASGQTLSGEDAVLLLDALNGMIQSWSGEGIFLPDFKVVNTADDLTIKAEDIDAVVYNLAVRASAFYGRDVTDDVKRTAADTMTMLRHRYFVVPESTQSHLPCVGSFNSFTGG